MRRKCAGKSAIAIGAGWAIGLLAAAGEARADIGPKPTTTGLTIGPGKDLEGIEVAMAAEEVDLRLSSVGKEKDRLEVTAVFTMRNPGAPAEFETGFPVGAYKDVFESFSVHVAGKKVDFDLVNRGGPEPASARARAEAGPRDGPDYWYVWKGAFPSGESRHEVRYRVKIVRHNMSGSTGYVLHTGAAWKGPIGKATIRLAFGPGYSPDHILSLSPTEGARREKDRYVWELTDIEPTGKGDIRIVYSEGSNAESLERVRAEAKSSWVGRENLVRVLARRPGNWLRSRMTPEELDEYLGALEGLVAEGKERDGKLVFPENDPGGRRRQYMLSPDTLLQWIEKAAEAAETYPESAKAQAVLARYVALGERFEEGKVFLGDMVLAAPSGPYGEKLQAKFAGWMEKARKATRGEGR